MSLRTPIGKVRGLGSAKNGTHHWWTQKITAIALVPLTIWFLASIVQMIHADYFTVKAWLSSPFVAVIMMIYLVTALHHLRLGLQSVVEDYIVSVKIKTFLQFFILYGCTILMAASVFFILKIAL
ncbi:MAG: succinate dehydrogenase, hydrophobic membrane anchor protein [Emcibacter sp.]|nr:succinate dehydrogenase, hydrophobic membrane anchor protein [Emcibacter sp.]